MTKKSQTQDKDDVGFDKDVMSWVDFMREGCSDYADSIRDDVDFSASLEQLEVMEAEGSTRHFSYGAYRVTLARKHAQLTLRLRRRKRVLMRDYKNVKPGEKVPSIVDREAMTEDDEIVTDLEDRLVELDYKIEMVKLAMACIVERNMLVPGIQGQRNQLNRSM